jgi:hypothetical protein
LAQWIIDAMLLTVAGSLICDVMRPSNPLIFTNVPSPSRIAIPRLLSSRAAGAARARK